MSKMRDRPKRTNTTEIICIIAGILAVVMVIGLVANIGGKKNGDPSSKPPAETPGGDGVSLPEGCYGYLLFEETNFVYPIHSFSEDIVMPEKYKLDFYGLEIGGKITFVPLGGFDKTISFEKSEGYYSYNNLIVNVDGVECYTVLSSSDVMYVDFSIFYYNDQYMLFGFDSSNSFVPICSLSGPNGVFTFDVNNLIHKSIPEGYELKEFLSE